jgi:hypothetical protein
MKALKYLLFSLFILPALHSTAQRVAIKSEGHQPVLVANERLVLNEWNEILKTQSGIDANLQQLSIIQVDKTYYLRGTSPDGYVSTILLEDSDSNGAGNYLSALGISCTSKSCGSNSGCLPNNNGRCTSGCVSVDSCTKTLPVPKSITGQSRCYNYFSCDANHFL